MSSGHPLTKAQCPINSVCYRARVHSLLLPSILQSADYTGTARYLRFDSFSNSILVNGPVVLLFGVSLDDFNNFASLFIYRAYEELAVRGSTLELGHTFAIRRNNRKTRCLART